MQSENLSFLIYFVPALVIAISLHEMMHALVGLWLGDDTAHAHGRISLNPLKHIDPITTVLLPIVLFTFFGVFLAAAKPVPINTYRLKFQEFGMALVAIAGPLTNFLIAIVCAAILRTLSPNGWVDDFLQVTLALNVGVGIFNLIPFPPLDGSRVLYALAPEAVQKVMMQIERLGFSAILLFVFIGFPLLSPAIITAQRTVINFLLGT